MELFICGNPRFLSGGKCAASTNYGNGPVTVEQRRSHTTVETAALPQGHAPAEGVQLLNQVLHEGKVGYHHTPSYNVFLRDGEWPSAGIELETHLREFTSRFAQDAMRDLKSNWFHFERDGSLDRAHSGEYGYELITEPLPPRAYRDQRLWTGLQNLCNPWLQSFQCEETGLHVHVGLNQFERFDSIPLKAPDDRRAIGKLLSAVVYYSVLDQAFVDRVVLRKPGQYCGLPDVKEFTDAAAFVRTGKATGASLVDYCVSALTMRRDSMSRDVPAAMSLVHSEDPGNLSWIGHMYMASGHGTEINQEHQYTIEFRRAKGTMHALSIHRIVELMTSIVRFAGKCCREPDFTVTRDSFMDWLIQTTSSEALRNLAKQTKGE